MEKNIKKGELYIEAIVYAVGLLYGIYLYSAGGYFINLLPIVFILGLVGKVIFDRPLMTTILGVVFNTFIVYQMYGVTGKENILSGIYVAIMLLAGEIVGQIYFAIYERNKKVKRSKKIKLKDTELKANTAYTLPISVILVLFSVITVHSYVNGNIVEYVKNKKTVEEYIIKTYHEDYKNFKLQMPRINLTVNNKDYIFPVKISSTGAIYNMVLKQNGYIEDDYKATLNRLDVIERKEKIDNILNNSIYKKNEYAEIMVIPSSNKLLIIKKVLNDSVEEKLEFSKQAYTIIEILKNNNLLESIVTVETRMLYKETNELLCDIAVSKESVLRDDFNETYIKEALEEEILEIH